MTEKKKPTRLRNLKKIKELIARREKVGLDRIKFTEQISEIKNERVIFWNTLPSSSYTIRPLKKEIIGKKPQTKRVATAKVVKKNWIKKIRNQRIIIKKNKKQVGSSYRKLYLEVKGNVFKNKKELEKRIKILETRNEKKTI